MGIDGHEPILVFVDTDAEGRIISAQAGRRIIPSQQYAHFFITRDERILLELENFRVINGALTYVAPEPPAVVEEPLVSEEEPTPIEEEPVIIEEEPIINEPTE